MGFSVDSVLKVLKMGREAQASASSQVGVCVYVDASATPFLVETVRRAFVPQTVAATVRVRRLSAEPEPLPAETDAVVVVSCGSALLEGAVGRLVSAGAPVAVVAESSVEAPFIAEDTRLLGLVAATDEAHLRDALARWILERTEKTDAFAANFPFMRRAASEKVVKSCALGNVATGALIWPKGADFPVMTLAQMGMALNLASIHGKELSLERAYELAGVLAAAFALRGTARRVVPRAGRAGFAVRAVVAGAGTWAMGLALTELYERDVDYTKVNEAVAGLVERARSLAAARHGADASSPLVPVTAAAPPARASAA